MTAYLNGTVRTRPQSDAYREGYGRIDWGRESTPCDGCVHRSAGYCHLTRRFTADVTECDERPEPAQ